MYSPPFSHTISIIALVLLCIISTAVLVLQHNLLSDISTTYQHLAFPLSPTEPKSLQYDIAGLPLHLARAPLNLALAASIVALIASIAALAGFLLTLIAGKRRFLPDTVSRIRPAYFTLPLLSLSAILALASLITTFITHAHSSTFNIAYWYLRAGIIKTYDIGHFDLEAWVCQMAAQNATREIRDKFRETCNNGTSGRWMLVPFSAMAALSVGLGWWTCRATKGPDAEAHEMVDSTEMQSGKSGFTR